VNRGVLVIVEPGALQQLVLHRKAERLDEMQRATGVGRQPDHVARVGRDFGMDEDDVEHASRPLQSPGAGVRASTHRWTSAAPAWRNTPVNSAAAGACRQDIVDQRDLAAAQFGAPLRLDSKRAVNVGGPPLDRHAS
jgi:hypothetical protein